MTPDRMETVPTAGRGLFASGIVLGLSLGFAAGHLLLFSRADRDVPATVVTAEQPPFDPSPWNFDGNVDADTTSDIAFSVMEFGDDPNVGRVTLSDEPSNDGLHYFPDSVLLDDEPNGDARLAFAEETAAPSPLRMTAELTPDRDATANDAAPKALEPAPSAAPIDEKTSQRAQLARAIIQEELPDATPEEREIWCDVLQGLGADDIKGILRMKKSIGPGRTPLLGAITTPSMPLIQPEHAAVSKPDDARQPARRVQQAETSLHKRLQGIDRHNMANRNTVAFKKLVPVMTEAAAGEGDGVRLVKVVRDMSPGEAISTGRMLDVAIDGAGFLQVRRGEEVRYTRDGRLEMDMVGRLKLLAVDDLWLLDPPITVPQGAVEVIIAADGTVQAGSPESPEPEEIGEIRVVRFLAPDALKPTGDGLYEKTPGAGMPSSISTNAPNASLLMQGHLEASNADPQKRQTTSPDR